jgi:hypothetical protein
MAGARSRVFLVYQRESRHLGGADPTVSEQSPLPSFITVHADGVTLAIKVQPRAPANAIGGTHAAELRVKVTAPPVDAAANEAVVRLLADVLGCPRANIEIVRGQTSRHKVVRVRGVDAAAVTAKLDPTA